MDNYSERPNEWLGQFDRALNHTSSNRLSPEHDGLTERVKRLQTGKVEMSKRRTVSAFVCVSLAAVLSSDCD
ncbi:hypothetical protein BaRGS_00026690 [Batillaria attramentaria]|uniref:Uncharacterized protein n=1 Tax=Batillaria attramentaria TaxID=370345 RepID=A0ABD0K445_9CAEN